MKNTATKAPTADWIRIDDLYDDPFYIFDRMRREAPVHWVPAVNRYMVTRYDACRRIELDANTFTADEDESLMKRAMGHSMLRKDGPEHDVERAAWQPQLRPSAIKTHWREMFEENTERCLDHLESVGTSADLIRDFAGPLAAENLRAVLGFRDTTTETMQRWSQTLIDATGNYADDPRVWADGRRSFDEIDDALDELMPYYRRHPDASLISNLVNGDSGMPIHSIRANLKMTIGGGLNEPRDALGVTAWALMDRPDQLLPVVTDDLWHRAFDEAIRWIAPIGMYPRQTTREVTFDDITIPAQSRLGVVVLSANRDDAYFDDADVFDVHREPKSHLAFGGGSHYCAGVWVARTAVADVALPALFARLPTLRIDRDRPVRIGGWVFRGLLSLPVEWSSR